MFKLEIAKYDNGEKYVIVDNEYNIFEPALFFIEKLYSSYKLNTRYNYLLKLIQFLNYLDGQNLTIFDFTPLMVPRYINFLQGIEHNVIRINPRLKGQSINTHLSALTLFYNSIEYQEQLIGASPFSYRYAEDFSYAQINKSFLYHSKINKKSKKKRQFAIKISKNDKIQENERKRKSKDEIKEFLQFLANDRDKLILIILYESGMRISELLNIKLDDYSEPGGDGFGSIKVVERLENEFESISIAKNRQIKTLERIIDIPNTVIERIDEYVISDRPFNKKESDFLFLASKGKPTPLSRERVEAIFRKASRQSGIKITPHMLRHTHITELSEAGMDNELIRYRVGHAYMESTLRYTHISRASICKAYQNYYLKKRERE